MGNQNQGLVVTLVIFIVLTLGLGVGTYFGFKTASETKQQLAQTQADLTSATSDNSRLTGELDDIKKKLGYSAISETKLVLEKLTADLAGMLGRADDTTTLSSAIAELTTNILTLNQAKSVAEAERDAEKIRADEEAAKAKAQNDMFLDAIAKIQQAREDDKADFDKLYADLAKKVTEMAQEVDQVKSQASGAIAEAKQESADASEAALKIAEINAELSARIDGMTSADFEREDGQVLFADQVNRIVHLNIGERDAVRPLTRFNVFRADALDMDASEPKGVVEVVRTLGESVCEARIAVDDITDPIMPGDLVYTPLWRSGEVLQYALDYHIDIDGDGKSDFNELVNLIEGSGAKVAAYITDDGEFVGKITPDVTRLVLSGESITDVLARDFSLDAEAKEKFQNDYAEYVKSAAQNSVRTIQLADFLHRVGYRNGSQITKYADFGDREVVTTMENGVPQASVSENPIAPIYTSEPVAPGVSPAPLAPIFRENGEKPVVSSGQLAPIYDAESEPARVSTGKTSDTYFRKRAPRASGGTK